MAAVLITACSPTSGTDSDEHLGEATSAVFVNGDFEAGLANQPPPSWIVNTFLGNNPAGITVQSPQTRAGLNLQPGGAPLTRTLVSLTGPETQVDAGLGAGASLRWPKYGNKVAIVNQGGNNHNVNALTQTMVIAPGDVDPADGKIHVRFVVAPVLENPNHLPAEQPFYFVEVTNVTTGAQLYTDFNVSAQVGVPWKIQNGLYYTDWQLVDVSPGAAALKQGDTVKLEVMAAGCSFNAHYGQVYVDGVGTTIPGLFVSTDGPAVAPAGTDITYTLFYKNGSLVNAAGVKIDFNTPPNTTFVSVNAPGLACVPPAVGMAGLMTCTVGALPAGGFGSFTVTVHIAPNAVGTIVDGNYKIYGTGISPLLGSKVTTIIGCVQDSDCNALSWCNETSHACTPKLANGVAVPNDPAHVNPTLNGTCTAAAGAATCLSGVCDPIDNKCGLLNNVGPCNAANGAVICRSGVCDPDLKCGFAVNDGPCNAANAGVVCRSGSCSANLLCQPAGGCNVDADCSGGNWCNEAAHTCTPKLANGTNIPSDPPHVNPTLNGTCTAAAALLVCVSGVCDVTDDKCGFANGDGPCALANGGVVCRSGACSQNLLCMPAGGCNVDADCAGGTWCNESAHACTPKLANGVAIPTDAPHVNPTLDGTCTAAAAALVCVSGVCDPFDNKCGLLNNVGPCNAGNAAIVCRSGVCDPDLKCGFAVNAGPCNAGNAAIVCRSGACSQNLLCEPAGGCNVDVDCSGGSWCNETVHTCTPKLTNGTNIPVDDPHVNPILNGTCTAAAAALVCASGVCDPADNKCGFANGDGPCNAGNAGTVCRSGACSANGSICVPAGGCGADADCASDQWCNTQMFACTPKLPNGQGVPTVSGHAPPLTGICTPGAGAAVCVSGVCDVVDNGCGFAVGDGPCNAQNGAVVCRSGSCSVNGLCAPMGGCNVDADCAGGTWCNESAHQCAPKVGNGGVMPDDPPHQNPTVDGTCTGAAAALVCASAVCDVADDKCGYANGDGTCTAADAGVVCRSSVCDPDGKCGFTNGVGPCTQGDAGVVCRSSACSTNGAVCIPAGGCAVDADCGPSEWCNTPAFTCVPKLVNGTDIPTVVGHAPPLAGDCTPGAGASVCVSGVCDAADDKCGFADGDGPCTQANGIVVCRSGSCGADGKCKAPTACNVDGDCDPIDEFCDTEAHLCAPKLPNGTAMPTVAGHQPVLDGQCSPAEAPVVCQSAVCDSDDSCGFASGTGPCTPMNAGVVCRSSTCSANAGVCVPSGGCAVDADCDAASFCNTASFSCAPKLANGVAIPTIGGHAPPLDGTCTAASGASVCASGVCDPVDNLCGLALGDGPCTVLNRGLICRSGACSDQGVCIVPVACVVDADCNTQVEYCDTGAHHCAPKVPNGTLLPAAANHSPTLDGTCSDASAKIVCLSGVCDVADNTCGHAIGKGPCDAASGDVVCRSKECATQGPNANLCVECVSDAQCGGSQAVCDPTKNACVQCTPANATACVGSTPICSSPPGVCAPCDGDFGAGTPDACTLSGAPYCFLTGLLHGQCGKCVGNDDCTGHPSGPFCDVASGACGTGCAVDADCNASSWCDAPAGGSGMCVPKLDNGTHLPDAPASVVTCNDAVGKRVCKSGACDPADDTCGLKNGTGPCVDGTVCRSGACDPKDQKCGLLAGDGPCAADLVCRTGTCDLMKMVCSDGGNVTCKVDADCPEADFCTSEGACTPKLPDGDACTSSHECQSNACSSGVCDGVVASGTGVLCSTRPGSTGDGTPAGVVGLMLLAAGLVRRRRR